jgi:hypothetical protein
VASLVPATSTIATVTITTPGRYTVAPSSPVAQGSTSGIGTTATFTMTYARTFQTVTAAPTTPDECWSITEPGPHKTFGLFQRNTYTRTVGTGTWSASMPTNSVMCSAAAPAQEMIGWTPPSNLGTGTGGVMIHNGAQTVGSNTIGMPISIIGKAGVTTGDIYGGYLGYSPSHATHEFAPFQFVTSFWIYTPNAAPGTGKTWTITTDIWECFG